MPFIRPKPTETPPAHTPGIETIHVHQGVILKDLAEALGKFLVEEFEPNLLKYGHGAKGPTLKAGLIARTDSRATRKLDEHALKLAVQDPAIVERLTEPIIQAAIATMSPLDDGQPQPDKICYASILNIYEPGDAHAIHSDGDDLEVAVIGLLGDRRFVYTDGNPGRDPQEVAYRASWDVGPGSIIYIDNRDYPPLHGAFNPGTGRAVSLTVERIYG